MTLHCVICTRTFSGRSTPADFIIDDDVVHDDDDHDPNASSCDAQRRKTTNKLLCTKQFMLCRSYHLCTSYTSRHARTVPIRLQVDHLRSCVLDNYLCARNEMFSACGTCSERI